MKDQMMGLRIRKLFATGLAIGVLATAALPASAQAPADQRRSDLTTPSQQALPASVSVQRQVQTPKVQPSSAPVAQHTPRAVVTPVAVQKTETKAPVAQQPPKTVVAPASAPKTERPAPIAPAPAPKTTLVAPASATKEPSSASQESSKRHRTPEAAGREDGGHSSARTASSGRDDLFVPPPVRPPRTEPAKPQSYDGRRDVDIRSHRHRHWDDFRYGARHVELRPGAMVIVLNSASYYYYDGIYYQPAGREFVEIYPPVGAVIPALPSGAVAITVGSVVYHYACGTFYLQQALGFVVVPPVMGVVVPEVPPGASAVVVDGAVTYFFNGVYYRPAFINGSVQYITFSR